MNSVNLNFGKSTDYAKDLAKAKSKTVKTVEFGTTAKFIPELKELRECNVLASQKLADSKTSARLDYYSRIFCYYNRLDIADYTSQYLDKNLSQVYLAKKLEETGEFYKFMEFVAKRINFKLNDDTYYIDRILAITYIMVDQSRQANKARLAKSKPARQELSFFGALLSTLAAIKKIRFGSITSKPESGYSSIRLLEAIENLEFRQVEKRQSKKVNYNKKLAKISVDNEYKETSHEAEILAKIQIQSDIESLIAKLKKPQAVKMLGLCSKLLITSKAKIYLNNILRRYASDNLKSLGLLDFIYVIKEYSKE